MEKKIVGGLNAILLILIKSDENIFNDALSFRRFEILIKY